MEKNWFKFYDKGISKSIQYPKIPIYGLLDKSAEKYPNNTISVFFGKKFLYKHIKEYSDSFALSLKKLGFYPEDRLILLLPNSPGFLIAYYGALKAGCIVVPLNPLYTEDELIYQISDSNAKAIVTIPIFLEKTVKIAKKLNLKTTFVSFISDFLPFSLSLPIKLKELKILSNFKQYTINLKNLLYQDIKDFHPVKPDINKTGIIIYSGGTTGTAKGIMLSHFAVVANVHQIAEWGELSFNDKILAILPLFHGYGMNVCMNTPIFKGMSIVMLPKFDAKQLAKTIHKYKPTMMAAVPTILTALSNLSNIEKYDFSSLKAVWVGAASLTKPTKENFEKKGKCKVIEGYGLTEAVTAIMANPYHGRHKIGSIGIPFPDVDVKIVSLEDGETSMEPNQIGEIVLQTPTTMLGYNKKEEETKHIIHNGWLYTGDIGYMDEDGYFYITDRKKDIIIVGGFNVYPNEVEEILYTHSCIKEAAVIGIPDEYKGEKIKAFVVLKNNQTTTDNELKSFLKERIVAYKIPSEIEFREFLPKTAIGKISRKILKDQEIEKIKKEKND